MSANLEDARRLLGKGALFRNLAPNDRNSLVARAHMRSFNAGDSIFLMGDLHDSMIAILEGEVRISVPSTDGKELMLAIVYAGEVFGEIIRAHPSRAFHAACQQAITVPSPSLGQYGC